MNAKLQSILVLLCLLGGPGSAQVNLLPQGSFENPGANTGWAEGFNIPKNREFQVISKDGKHWLRIENTDPGRQLDYVHAFVRVDPRIATLTVSVRMRATNLKVGPEGWHDARVALMFEGGSFGYPPVVPELRADSDWVTQTVELKVPSGATRLNIQPALFRATGVFEIADLTVTPHLVAPTTLGDATLPAGMSLNWDNIRVETINRKRAQVSLDGVWRFIPAPDGAVEPPRVGWAYIKVPGDWQLHRDKATDFVARGSGPQWDLYDGSAVSRAWYERQAPIPAEWQGRAISLRFDRVSTDAMVYVNGMECGRVSWPWGSVDITRAVTPGKTADIRVLVAAVADSDRVGSFWQNAFQDVTYASASLETRGLTHSVFLESRLSAPTVTDVFVRPSTRQKTVSLDVEITGVKQAGKIQFVAAMCDEKGAVEKSFTADAAVEARETQTITLSWPWANPRLWDVGQPNLYTLRLDAQGAGLDDEYDQEFGFREFWVEGRKFFLNGTEIRLRQRCFYWGEAPQVGDNFSEDGPTTVDTRGDAADSGPGLAAADRKAYLIAEYILNANKYMMDSSYRFTWNQNKQRAMERAAVWMRHYRNHPSVVMWIAGFNFFGSPVDEDPRHLGRHGWDQTNNSWQRNLAAAKEMFAGLRGLDPTRVFYSHAGAYTGDVYTVNCYLDLIPIQEREDWLSEWAQNGEMPISMVEFGTPMDCTFRRGRDGFTSNITSEPLLTEYSAIYCGTEAYSLEEPKYREYLRTLFVGGMLYNSSENHLDDYANMHKIQQIYRVNTWRSWRTAGMPGGLRTWSWIQDSLKENNGPTLAWIAGPTRAYTAKDHHFKSGQKIEKQVALLNDTRQPQDFTAAWTATVGRKVVGRGALHGTLAVAETRLVPFRVTMPAMAAGQKADGQIVLTALIGKVRHDDAFPFRVFGGEPAVSAVGTSPIAVVDPGGKTTAMLVGLGYHTRTWSGTAVRLVVIGRNALKNDPTTITRLEPYVRGGGRVLICTQDPEWLTQALGWRVCPQLSRRVFPMNSSVASGLDADDLRDWTGASTLVEAYPQYVGNYLKGNEGDQPYAGWHWGNRGAVTSAVIEKPHRSGWRPLLECEFDLAYTPLMELDYGKGRLIVSTLDLEDYMALDPAARRMAGRLVDYALNSRLAPRIGKVGYLGGAAGAAWLDKIGVSYQQTAALDPSVGLLLIGPDAAIDNAALKSYLEKGGRAFYLPRVQADAGFGAVLKSAPQDFAGSLSVPVWPEARGLSASDLRWRTHLDTAQWVVSAGADIGANGLIGRKAVGKGVVIYCQVDPERFQADEKTYFRYTRWRSTRAVAQILANLGASFPVDSHIFRPFDTTFINLDGDWRMKVTLPLSPAKSDATANADPGVTPAAQKLVGETAPAEGWTSIRLPRMAPFFDDHDGEAVFRKEIVVPAREAGKEMVLALGALDDFDTTYFNGVEIGHTDQKTARWWLAPRNYVVPGKLIKAGRNVIAVRLFDRFNQGGFVGNSGLPMSLRPDPRRAGSASYYHADYRTDFIMGDNPYRYYRW
jgi:beta-galactosidase